MYLRLLFPIILLIERGSAAQVSCAETESRERCLHGKSLKVWRSHAALAEGLASLDELAGLSVPPFPLRSIYPSIDQQVAAVPHVFP